MQDGESRVRVEIHPVDTVEKPDPAASLPSALDRPEGPGDTSPVDAFLSGQNCLTGVSTFSFLKNFINNLIMIFKKK